MKVPRCGRSLTYGHPAQTTHLPSFSTFPRMEFAFCGRGCDKGLRNRLLETVEIPEKGVLLVGSLLRITMNSCLIGHWQALRSLARRGSGLSFPSHPYR